MKPPPHPGRTLPFCAVLLLSAAAGAAQDSVVLECTATQVSSPSQGENAAATTRPDTRSYTIDHARALVTDAGGTTHPATIEGGVIRFGDSWSGAAMGGFMERKLAVTIDRASGAYSEARSTRTSDGRSVFAASSSSQGHCVVKQR